MGVARAVDAVRRTDPDAEKGWQDRLKNRLAGCRQIVARMHNEGTLKPGLDPAAAAEDWYRREGVIPINHMFAVRRELSREHPEVVREIFRMIVESRDMAPESVTANLPPIGLEANRKGLEMAIDWSFEQKIIPRRLSVDELFDDITAALRLT